MTVTATNESNGDSSGFSNAVAAQPVSVSFATAALTVQSTDGMATIDVQRSGNLAVAVSVSYATRTARRSPARITLPSSGILIFAPNQTDKIILDPDPGQLRAVRQRFPRSI